MLTCRKLGIHSKAARGKTMRLPVSIFVTVPIFIFATPAFAQNFGAIAYDGQSNAYGVSWDANSQEAANQFALNKCAKNGNNCYVVVEYVNQCGAYATGPGDIWGKGTGGSRDVAQRFATSYCNQHGSGCAIRAWGCNSMSGGGPTYQGDASPKYDIDANRRRAEEQKTWGGQEQYDRVCRESGGC